MDKVVEIQRFYPIIQYSLFLKQGEIFDFALQSLAIYVKEIHFIHPSEVYKLFHAFI
jgi:hypothetical protein